MKRPNESLKDLSDKFPYENHERHNLYIVVEYINHLEQRIKQLEEAGKEATSLIAHLKDLHGFIAAEERAQDKIMSVFKYEGRY